MFGVIIQTLSALFNGVFTHLISHSEQRFFEEKIFPVFFKLYGIPRISAASFSRRLLTFLSQMRRLIKSGPYSSK